MAEHRCLEMNCTAQSHHRVLSRQGDLTEWGDRRIDLSQRDFPEVSKFATFCGNTTVQPIATGKVLTFTRSISTLLLCRAGNTAIPQLFLGATTQGIKAQMKESQKNIGIEALQIL